MIVYQSLNYHQVIQWNHQTPYVLFYRNDCRDCQALYPQLVKAQLLSSKITSIDLTQEKNRHYIQEFGVVEVPTLFQCDSKGNPTKEWMGTNDIHHQLHQINQKEK